MSTLMVGAGAVGGYFAVELANAGTDIAVLARGARAENLRRDGLRLIAPDGNSSTTSVQVHSAEDLDGPVDLIMLAVKATALPSALDDIAGAVGPGTAILPAALVAGEMTGCSGQQLLVGIASAYEVMERMASEFIPTVMSRGFHAGPVFGIFGAAVAAAKIEGMDADRVNSAIAQCVNLASGNLEGIRSGGRSLREGAAV